MSQNNDYEMLKLDNQLCFPLYACSKEIIKRYKPFLDKIDLTYTQYLAMMVLWEHNNMNVKELGDKLFLDSGTLTPLLKKLEEKQYITRERSKTDERSVSVTITEKGLNLRDDAKLIPAEMGRCVNLPAEDAASLYRILRQLMTVL